MNITELKELAEKATPGPWFVVGQPWNPKADFIVAGSEDPHVGQYVADTEDFDGEGRNVQENAAYIAAANPAAILELIAKLEEAQAQMERQKDEWLSWEAKRRDLEKAAAQLENAQGEIRALRATEAGLVERVKELEKGLTKIKNWKARDGSILDGPKDFARALLEKKE